MTTRPFILAIVLVGCSAGAEAAQLSPSDRAAIETYKSALKSAESGASRALEAAFSAIPPMRNALLQARDTQTIVLESLSDEEYTRLASELKGIVLNREEVLLVEPDPDYFTTLAASRGDVVDRAFFAALKATYPESVWPVYIVQQTDFAGCTRFGSMSLVETYRRWSDFQRTYPDRYLAGAQEEADAVVERLARSTCACGDMTAVEQEFVEFQRRFPTSSIRAAVDERLEAVRTRRSDIRTSCLVR